MKVEIVKAELSHVINLVESLRERERLAFTLLGQTAEKMIAQELAKSFVAYAGLVDGKCGAIWGAHVEGLLSDEAYIWLICGTLVEQHPIVFLRHSRAALDEFKHYFSRLHGFVVCDFEKSTVWLEWLGFKIGEPINGVRAFSS